MAAKVKIKKFSSQLEQFKWLVSNQELMKAQRRSEPKKSDGHSFGFTSFAVDDKGERLKAEDVLKNQDIFEKGVLKVKCVINATNILDSHRDLHLPGIWKKSLSEKKLIYLCQEHNLTFKGIISDEVKAYTEVISFKDLGFKFEGSAECLIFDAVIRKDRNEYMFGQYAKGFVRNHSVRMQYVKEYFCMDSDLPEATQYKENYDKYAPMVANKECLETVTWFYAVTQAKIVDEGSAVVKGSCSTTPTLEVTESENKDQPSKDTDPPEPAQVTQKSDAEKQWEEFKNRKN